MEECQQREAELISKLQKTPKLKKKILIEQKGDKKRKREPDESDEEAPKKDKGVLKFLVWAEFFAKHFWPKIFTQAPTNLFYKL